MDHLLELQAFGILRRILQEKRDATEVGGEDEAAKDLSEHLRIIVHVEPIAQISDGECCQATRERADEHEDGHGQALHLRLHYDVDLGVAGAKEDLSGQVLEVVGDYLPPERAWDDEGEDDEDRGDAGTSCGYVPLDSRIGWLPSIAYIPTNELRGYCAEDENQEVSNGELVGIIRISS